MKHGYGLKLNGSCSQVQRRFLPMNVCTAYVTFDHATINQLQEGYTQWRTPERIQEVQYDQTVSGFPYNCNSSQPIIDFNNYYFNKSEIDSWSNRGYECVTNEGSGTVCGLVFSGPKFKNNFAAIPLTQHKINPISKLKKGRLAYDFLDANSADILSPLVDPMEYAGVYPYSPDDSETIRKPAGWMYSNRNVLEPYYTEINYEGSGSKINRSTADTTQMDFLPFLEPLNVYDISEKFLGQFDGLAFVLFYGEMAFKLPVVDLPEYEGIIPELTQANSGYTNPSWQIIGLEVNIFLTGKNIPSPRIGRVRWYLQNRVNRYILDNDPSKNYFTTYFKQNLGKSITMPINFKIRPSQLGSEDNSVQQSFIPLSNLKVMVGA